MQLGRVVGMVTGTAKDVSSAATSCSSSTSPMGAVRWSPVHQIVVDAVGAGIGDLVLVTTGSGARQSSSTRGSATDATAVAIIDEITIGSDGARKEST